MSLIILIGVPGCGKSTFASEYLDESFICEADSFPGLYKNGLLQGNLLPTAHEVCHEKVRRLMQEKQPYIIQSNTNLRIDSIIPYLVIAMTFNYQVQFVLPKHDLLYYEHNWSRNKQIQEIIKVRSQGEKIVPEHVIIKLVSSFDDIKSKLTTIIHYTDPNVLYKLLQS